MVSLRRRMLLVTAGGSALVLMLAGVALYGLMRTSLLGEFDKSLIDKAATLAALVEQDGDEIDAEFIHTDMPEFVRAERPEYFQLSKADGSIVERSASLRSGALRCEARGPDTPTVRAIVLPDGRPGRVVTMRFKSRIDDEADPGTVPSALILCLARDVIDVEAKLYAARFGLAVVGIAAVAVTVGVLAWLVRLGIKPVDRIAREIAAIDEQRLSARIPGDSCPVELRPVVDRLNELLQRVEGAMAREKAMTADVAHELRTPLSGLRSTLEVALSRERDAASYRQSLSECLVICRQTQTLTENLLALARLDAGSDSVRRETVAVGELLDETWPAYEEAAAERELSVRWSIEPDLRVETDRTKVLLVLRNLLENAVHYADARGNVEINGARVNGCVRIGISNSGSSVSSAEVEHVFDRFWRGDQSRQDAGLHSGLGLSICRSIMGRLGGEIAAESAGGWFRVVVTL